MTAAGRALWIAANIARFVSGRAVTLAKLHERERVALAGTLHTARRIDASRKADLRAASAILMNPAAAQRPSPSRPATPQPPKPR